MPNIKEATPTQIDFSHSWNGTQGTFYDWNIKMDNGDEGQYTSKSNQLDQIKFQLNVKTQYTIEKKKNGQGFKIKPYSPPPQQGSRSKSYSPEQQQHITNGVAMRSTIRLYVNAGFGLKEKDQFVEIYKYYKAFLYSSEAQKVGGQRVSGLLYDAIDSVKIHATGEKIFFNSDITDPVDLAKATISSCKQFVKITQ